MKQIAKLTGVKYKIVNGIYKRSKYTAISSHYNFDNFSNFERLDKNKHITL
jgi:hypothetical protein